MHAVKAIYDGETFIPEQPFPTQGPYSVIITFVNPIPPPFMEATFASEHALSKDWLTPEEDIAWASL